MSLPDFFIIGAPKAGTTALHAALRQHPQVLMSRLKEPKFFLCKDGRPSPQSGPGDAHSAKEWITTRSDYEALFEGPKDLLRGESTAFYLYDRESQHRIAAMVPDAKLIAIVRDPIDRAHSNWLHLWADGLESEADFGRACSLEDQRVADGWGAFWHYIRLGKYGEQLRELLTVFPSEQVMVLRYRELVDSPADTLDGICRFLGVEPRGLSSIPPENSRGFVPQSARTRILGGAIRAGATAGAAFPPQVWRKASHPLLQTLQHGSGPRPVVSPELRRELLGQFEEDIRLLGEVTGSDFSDWLGDQGRGEFQSRINRQTDLSERDLSENELSENELRVRTG